VYKMCNPNLANRNQDVCAWRFWRFSSC